jgi:hypothetical protein
MGLKDNKVIINREEKGEVEIARDKVALVKLSINFD